MILFWLNSLAVTSLPLFFCGNRLFHFHLGMLSWFFQLLVNILLQQWDTAMTTNKSQLQLTGMIVYYLSAEDFTLGNMKPSVKLVHWKCSGFNRTVNEWQSWRLRQCSILYIKPIDQQVLSIIWDLKKSSSLYKLVTCVCVFLSAVNSLGISDELKQKLQDVMVDRHKLTLGKTLGEGEHGLTSRRAFTAVHSRHVK